MPIDYSDAPAALACFRSQQQHDRERLKFPDYLHRWLFMERLVQRGQRKELNFFEFDGPAHIQKFFRWIRDVRYGDFFADPQLIEDAAANDSAVMRRYGLAVDEANIRAVALYNAQDYQLQRFYPVPERLRINRVLDFGAGHGRMANLTLKATGHKPATGFVAVDGIPSSYLTQNLYYKGLGLSVAEYLDRADETGGFDVASLAQSHDVVHLPTWRMDLLPEAWFDMVCCVQVLKELPSELVPHVVAQFARVLKPGGALYIRDHPQFHNPNQMPIDDVLQANGFLAEFRPQLIDRRELHGLPRIWRKLDPRIFLESDPSWQAAS